MNIFNTLKQEIVSKKWIYLYYSLLVISLTILYSSYNKNDEKEKYDLSKVFLEHSSQNMEFYYANSFHNDKEYNNEEKQIDLKRMKKAFFKLTPLTNISLTKSLEYNVDLLKKYLTKSEMRVEEIAILKSVISDNEFNKFQKENYVVDRFIKYELFGYAGILIVFGLLRFIIYKDLDKSYQKIILKTVIILYLFSVYNHTKTNFLNMEIDNLITKIVPA